MSWEFAPAFDAAHRASLETGKSLVYVCPPAAWTAAPLFARVLPTDGAGLHTLIVTPGTAAALDLDEVLAPLSHHHPVHVATGLARTERLLRGGSVRTLLVTAPDGLELVRRAALKLEGLRCVALAWPEAAAPLDHSPAIDTLLSEAAEAQRLILTENASALAGMLERHARRAPLLIAAPPAVAPAPAPASAGPVRYAVVDGPQRRAATAAVADALNPGTGAVWGPGPPGSARDPSAVVAHLPGARVWEGAGSAADLLIALDLPTVPLLAELRVGARELVVLVAAWQLPSLTRMASPLRPLRLAGATDRARDYQFALRQRLRERLQAGGLEGELLMLEPLFDEHDPALVAAAAVALGSRPPQDIPAAELPAWVRVRVNVGRRAAVRVADLVGALLHGVRLARDDVGKVDLHEGFALVDVRPGVAEQVVRELSGMTLRGHRLTATIDRR